MHDPATEARFTEPRDECPNPGRWTSVDVDATENEVIAGVGGLVRLLQPEYVIETGTYKGHMAAAIAAALKDNGHGHLDTLEIKSELCEEARFVIGSGMDVTEIHNMDAMEFWPKNPIDFAWLDSDSSRGDEFMRYHKFMHSRTVVGFHDTGIHHRVIKEQVIQLAEQGFLVPIFLPTPRGVALCQVL